ncbi:MAG: thiosulfate/3-mercaptopyruvate sulfurtransferase [Colwellia sp.]|jgi:thiosulfate/3-mercaptopyruvate sulfurtransferase
MKLIMLTTYQQVISCHQLHELIFSTSTPDLISTVNSEEPKKNLIILDASIPAVGQMNQPEKQWPDFSLPNAQRFDLNKNFSDLSNPLPHTMPSSEYFQQQANALGITNDAQIIVYDDQGLFSAARAWYMFKSMGHKNIAILDGGLPEWLKSGFPVSSAKSSPIEIGNFTAKFSKEYFCNSDDIYNQLDSDENIIVDARAGARFKGKVAEPRKGVRRGHIPNSVNLPFSDLLKNGVLLPKNILEKKFKKINIQDKPMIMSCGSGVTACVLALTAEICGYQQMKVYDGSWSEWGANIILPVSIAE